jgi:hypothetical protein
LLIFLIVAGASGCFLFHRETPQQKMLDALERGNGAEVVNLWQHMSQKDRMKFNLGQGLKPAVPPKEAAKILSQMPPDELPKQITIKPPDTGGTLMDLPQMMRQQQAGPAPAPSAESGQQPDQP